MVPDQIRSRYRPVDAGCLVPLRMLRRAARSVAMLALSMILAASAPAQTHRPVEYGVDGLVAVPFEAVNAGEKPIACGASLAHWYSLDLGEAAPGDTVVATLWFDPDNGEMYLLNASQDRMAVESLWCGVAGRSWETRSTVALERQRRGAARTDPPLLRAGHRPAGMPVSRETDWVASVAHPLRPSSARRTATKRAARSACSAGMRSGM